LSVLSKEKLKKYYK